MDLPSGRAPAKHPPNFLYPAAIDNSAGRWYDIATLVV